MTAVVCVSLARTLAPSPVTNLAENTLDSVRTVDINSTINYELSYSRGKDMHASVDSVANGADDVSRPMSAAISPDEEVHFRPQAMSSARDGNR